MARFSPAAQAPVLRPKRKTPMGEIASLIPMSCEQITGQLTVSFADESLLSIASKMLMEEFMEVNDEVMDVAGEITNMITGGAKVGLQESGYEFGMSRPQTYLKRDFDALSLLGDPRIVVPYQVDKGLFYIDLGFVET